METGNTYDYIIAGAGCAGLSLAVHLVRSGAAKGKSILLIDRDPKESNDRTWCFWEKEEGPFQSIVHQEWKALQFHSSSLSKSLDIAPYTYKLIRGLDFYRYCKELLSGTPGVVWLQEKVTQITSGPHSSAVVTEGGTYTAGYVFSSIREDKPRLQQGEYWLLQHFTGWFIRTDRPSFDPCTATLMDFRTGQDEGATFFYVMPFSETEALVEYTLFSPGLLTPCRYEAALQHYIVEQLGIASYEIMEEEFGVIPMTNHPFKKEEGRIIYLGTAGGQTKGSSGYTFRFIQKHSASLCNALLQTGSPHLPGGSSSRFQFYDSVLLHILQHRKLPGDRIFSDLFRRNRAADVLRFLDNESTLPQEVRLISTLPILPFTKAAFHHLF